jgi:hypothetical protein
MRHVASSIWEVFLRAASMGILRNPDSDSKKIRREKPGPGLEKNPASSLRKPGLDF